MVTAIGISSARQAARLVIARWTAATAITSSTSTTSGDVVTDASCITNSWPSHAAAPLSTIARASEIDAPTVRIRPHESLASKVFQVITPNGGQSRISAAISAGIAGDK